MGEWRRVKIGDLCQIIKGETGLASALPGEYPLVATGAERRSCATWQFDTEAVCIPLVSSTGHGKKTLNYVHYQSGKFALGTILAAVIPKDPSVLTARFLHLYLSHFKDTVLVPLMKGAANVSLPMKAIASVEIPVPPMEAQQNLMDLICRIEDEHGALLSETNRQGDFLKQLRQAVLQEAVEGKLTAAWRKQHPVVKDDPQCDAVALLAQIKAEKERLVKEGKIRKEKPLPPIADDDKPFDLPDGWVWCRLGEVFDVCGGIQKTPSRKPVLNYYPYLGVQNVQRGYLALDNVENFEATISEFERLRLQNGDLLVIEGNGSLKEIGRCAIWQEQLTYCIHQNHIIRLRPILVEPEYILKMMNSPTGIEQMQEKAKTTTGLYNLSAGKVKTVILTLPPLAEQQAIVARADSLMAVIDNLEKQVAERKEQAQLLMQTVLREAFDGN